LICTEFLFFSFLSAQNPIMPGADPHVIYVADEFWMYPTDGYANGAQFYTYSSTDGVEWERHGPILDFKDIPWIYTDGRTRCGAWAPGVIEKNGKFYFYYSVGPQSERHPSRIGVAVGNKPEGPFKDSGQPLLTGGNGFEAIDPMVFTDPNSGKSFLYAGGSAGATLRVFEMNDDMVSFAREIQVQTPPNFTEGAFMHFYKGVYYFSYSHGGWKDASYSVHYATSPTPTGPWTYRGPILTSSEKHKGPGHHSFVYIPRADQWYIFYHRWNNKRGDGPYRGGRRLAAEKVEYDKDGLLKPILITEEGITLTLNTVNTNPSVLDQFKISSDKMILEPRHIYNFSGTLTVRPNVNTLGFADSFSPPFLANPFSALWKVNNQTIRVLDYAWEPARTITQGQLSDTVSIEQHLIPLAGKRAFACKVIITNKGPETLKESMTLELNGRVGKADEWGWVPPSAGGSDNKPDASQEAFVWTAGPSAIAAVFHPRTASVNAESGSASFSVDIPPQASQELVVVIAIDRPEAALQNARSLLPDIGNQIDASLQAWPQKFIALQDRLPRLITMNEKLQRFYQRCLLTFLTTRWELPEAAFTPWYAESGIDGGAVCSYLWGDAYLSKFLTLADPAATRALLLASMKADYSTHYAINITDGAGLGVGYSYDYYSMALLAYDYIALTGDMSLLNETVRGKPFLDALYDYVFEREDMSKPPVLIDYGTHENLLELRRTQAYQHYTPSPNLERVLSCRMLDEMFRWAGRSTPVDLNARADQLSKILLSRLWNDELKWFHSMDQNQQLQTCYSIQIFDILRTGVLSPRQAKDLVSHLNEEEFLSAWGVHSMSKKDPGYDSSDIDWGGPGVYAGDAPELAADLMQAGFVSEGIDVLERILWWGELPYIPQAVRADVRDYRRDGRANVIAAMTGPQAVIWGLFGLSVNGDTLTINPVDHPYIKGMRAENIRIRGRHIAISIDPDGKRYSVESDSDKTQQPIGRPCRIPLDKLNYN
jgi:hypothetical protein